MQWTTFFLLVCLTSLAAGDVRPHLTSVSHHVPSLHDTHGLHRKLGHHGSHKHHGSLGGHGNHAHQGSLGVHGNHGRHGTVGHLSSHGHHGSLGVHGSHGHHGSLGHVKSLGYRESVGHHGSSLHNHPNHYNYNYVVHDEYSGNHFGHSEARKSYDTEGKYFVNLPDGRVQTVTYLADESGYHPTVSYEGEARYGPYNPTYVKAHAQGSAYETPTIPSRASKHAHHAPEFYHVPSHAGSHVKAEGSAFHALPHTSYNRPAQTHFDSAYHAPETSYNAPGIDSAFHAPETSYNVVESDYHDPSLVFLGPLFRGSVESLH